VEGQLLESPRVCSICLASWPWSDWLHLQGPHTKSHLWPERRDWSHCLGKGYFGWYGNSSCGLSCHCHVERGTHYPKWAAVLAFPGKDGDEWSFQVLYVVCTKYSVQEEDDRVGDVVGTHDPLYGSWAMDYSVKVYQFAVSSGTICEDDYGALHHSLLSSRGWCYSIWSDGISLPVPGGSRS
jgi:hypothetical protein